MERRKVRKGNILATRSPELDAPQTFHARLVHGETVLQASPEKEFAWIVCLAAEGG